MGSDTNVSDPTPPDTSDTNPTQMCRIRHHPTHPTPIRQRSDTNPTQMCQIRHHPTRPTPRRHQFDTRHATDACVGHYPTHPTPSRHQFNTRHATDACVGQYPTPNGHPTRYRRMCRTCRSKCRKVSDFTSLAPNSIPIDDTFYLVKKYIFIRHDT